MKTDSLLRLAAALAAISLTAPALAERDIRQESVQFPKGKTGVTLKGTITGPQVADYRVRASAGQVMDVVLRWNRTTTYFNILPPGDATALFNGSIYGERYSGALPRDGDYTIRVYLMGDAKSSGHTASYSLDIDLSDRPVSASSGSAPPAKYDASGKIRCSEGNDSLNRECDFRVVRNLSSGSAQIWIGHAPGGRTRVLHFTDRRFTTDDGGAVAARRQNDNWRLGIGNREFYLIPDAVIHGG
ncbi:MAG: hypothetical protein FIB06_05815 [Betaproteobacteria bacterium]|nr:hypothetical protein [Betaproteobacteria bacterium]